MKNKIYLTLSLLGICLLISIAFIQRNIIIYRVFLSPRSITNDTQEAQISLEKKSSEKEIVAQNLQIPWDIAFLPSGDMLVTERSGNILRINTATKLITRIADVKHIGEGGLLGIALHPKFASNGYVYLYSTTVGAGGIENRVQRYIYKNDSLIDKTTILDGIRGSSNHDGGRIIFGPDGYLYVTTGDAEIPASAQDKTSLNGKILRIKDDGSIPIDNPFGNAIFSLGHRNPQGLAWDSQGQLWETEHGPSGVQTGYDEVNRIQKGANYGWPLLRGDQKRDGYTSPVIQSGSRDTWAPAGLVYINGSLFFTGLRGEAVYEAKINTDTSLTLHTHLRSEYGRLRAITVNKDRYMYISTSNTDGRGMKKEGDDKIIKVDPSIFR